MDDSPAGFCKACGADLGGEKSCAECGTPAVRRQPRRQSATPPPSQRQSSQRPSSRPAPSGPRPARPADHSPYRPQRARIEASPRSHHRTAIITTTVIGVLLITGLVGAFFAFDLGSKLFSG